MTFELAQLPFNLQTRPSKAPAEADRLEWRLWNSMSCKSDAFLTNCRMSCNKQFITSRHVRYV